MRISSLVSILPVVAAAPAIIERADGPAPLLERATGTPGKYIVRLKDGVHATSSSSAVKLLNSEPEHTYENVFKGFAASLDAETLEALRKHPEVDFIEQDGISRAAGYVTQNNAVWGIARISSRRPGGKTYTYDSSAGEGTCAYVIDSGVDDTHPDFEGRAKQVKSWIQGSNRDDFGHGTHVSGTIGSKTYGVAKKIKIYGFKGLGSNGSGPDSGIIAAIDDVPRDAATRDCPKGVVVNLSLTADTRLQSMNDAVANLVKKGIFVAAAAGNSFRDANNESPASEPSICTVGATESNDAKALYSNTGAVIDIQAPGSNVQSTTVGGGSGTMSGTSMASPHIAGLAAYLAAFEGIKINTACERIKELSTKNVVTGEPSGTTKNLAFNGNPSG